MNINAKSKINNWNNLYPSKKRSSTDNVSLPITKPRKRYKIKGKSKKPNQTDGKSYKYQWKYRVPKKSANRSLKKAPRVGQNKFNPSLRGGKAVSRSPSKNTRDSTNRISKPWKAYTPNKKNYDNTFEPRSGNLSPQLDSGGRKKNMSIKIKNSVSRLHHKNNRFYPHTGNNYRSDVISRNKYSFNSKNSRIPGQTQRSRSPKIKWKKWRNHANSINAISKVKQYINSNNDIRTVTYQRRRYEKVDSRLKVLERQKRRVRKLKMEISRLKFMIEKDTQRNKEKINKKDLEERWALKKKLRQAMLEKKRTEIEYLRQISTENWTELRKTKKQLQEEESKEMEDKFEFEDVS